MIKKCVICDNEFEVKGSGKMCSDDCKRIAYNERAKKWRNRNKDKVSSSAKQRRCNTVDDRNEKLKMKLGDDYDKTVECGICGLRANDLTSHITRIHEMSIQDYKGKYGPIRSEEYLKRQSDRIKGDKNPAAGHNGEYSPFSVNFYLRQGHSQEESEKLAIDKQQSKNHKAGSNCIEYWLNRGHTKEDAKQKLKERQSTNSKSAFIGRYGKEEGIKKWKERQVKWQNTLKSKPQDEIDEINRKKLGGLRNIMGRGYSVISQELFSEIYKCMDNKDVYFAILHDNEIIPDSKNNEYVVKTINGKHRMLDFYIPSLKKCIEFDGDYYHSEKFKKGNIERDRIRESEIKDTISDIQILHVTEKSYRDDPNKVVQECLEFIYE